LPDQAPRICFRIVVRAIEAWLLAAARDHRRSKTGAGCISPAVA
jgi:hypothetical protein